MTGVLTSVCIVSNQLINCLFIYYLVLFYYITNLCSPLLIMLPNCEIRHHEITLAWLFHFITYRFNLLIVSLQWFHRLGVALHKMSINFNHRGVVRHLSTCSYFVYTISWGWVRLECVHSARLWKGASQPKPKLQSKKNFNVALLWHLQT